MRECTILFRALHVVTRLQVRRAVWCVYLASLPLLTALSWPLPNFILNFECYLHDYEMCLAFAAWSRYVLAFLLLFYCWLARFTLLSPAAIFPWCCHSRRHHLLPLSSPAAVVFFAAGYPAKIFFLKGRALWVTSLDGHATWLCKRHQTAGDNRMEEDGSERTQQREK